MALDNNVRDNDQVFESHDIEVIVDDRTLAYLQSATVHFVQENGRSGFQIQPEDPPQVSGCSSCASASEGCG
jgi:Fe-S cluster assembly iron-binding protein IscA